MKRCPECRRDYTDDTLLYCLEDGTGLVQGLVPSPDDEPATAILRGSELPSESPTRAFSNTTDQTAILPSGITDMPMRGFDKRLLGIPFLLVVIVLGGFFGYKYVSPAKQIESIAVMPFVNESGNQDVEYLSDGMTETLINSLSNVPNLNVKARSSVFRYKGKDTDAKTIGKELNVQAVLNGRVVQRGEQLTLHLELVDVSTENVIWTEQYNRKQSDLVTLQSEIAKDVSSKLKSKLSGAHIAKVTKSSSADPEAYQAYLKGRYYWNRRTAEDLKRAIEQFKVATDRDPNYALAYAGLADCSTLLPQYVGIPSSEAMPQARSYAERAIALDDQLAEPHTSLGQLNRMSWQWAAAEREFKRAIELNPNYATIYHWYGELLKALGRFDEAALMIKRAKELDPLSGIIGVNISEMYQLQNDQQASIENSLKLIELDPNFPLAYNYLGLSYLKLGRNAEAIASIEKGVELSKRDSNALTDLGYGYAVIGRRSDALAIAKELEANYARKESNGLNVAEVYVGLGDKDKAFEWLEKDFKNKENVADIRYYITFESLRDDPRFKDLLKRMNLPE